MSIAIARQVSKTILPTVDRPKPNKAESVQYSTLVANFHIVTATHTFTEIGDLIRVACMYYYITYNIIIIIIL